MKDYYKRSFAINSPVFIILLIGTLVLGVMLRLNIPRPDVLYSEHVTALSRFALTPKFITSASLFFCWVEFILSILTILTLYFLGQNMAGKVSGICAAFAFAVYPYFVTNLYTINIFVVFAFILYLLSMYVGVHTMSKFWNLLAGIFFTISCIIEPVLIILGILPYIYFLIKQRHVATLNSMLFFLIGVIVILGVFGLLALMGHNLSNFIPIGDTLFGFADGIKKFIASPLKYITEIIWPYLRDNFAYPAVNGTYSYLHYFIIVLAILGLLYSFVDENVRILSIILIFMLLQAFLMPFDYVIIFLMFILLASFMVDKVVKDVLEL